MALQSTATLVVADAQLTDKLRDDIVRVSPHVVTDLQLVPGDRIRIASDNTPTPITKEVWRLTSTDIDADERICMTLGTRSTLGVEPGDTVTIAPCDA